MTKSNSKKCPNCGGTLKFDPNTQKLACLYCQSSFPTDYYAETREEDLTYCSHMNEYRCDSCGSALLIDENTLSSTCAYCHSNITLLGRLSNDIVPDKIIPFAFDKEEAKNIFLDTTKKMKYLPKDFLCESQLNNIQGIYYPFWLIDADVDATATFKSSSSSVSHSGDYKITTTTYYSHRREGNIKLEDVSSCAISKADKKMVEGVFPFPFNQYKDFNQSYLVGFNTQKKDLDKSNLTKEIHDKIKNYSIRKLNSTTPIGSKLDTFSHTINSEHWTYALLPIYILTYIKNDKKYIFAINGYTKKIYGQYPISFSKIFLRAIIIIVIFILIGIVGDLIW